LDSIRKLSNQLRLWSTFTEKKKNGLKIGLLLIDVLKESILMLESRHSLRAMLISDEEKQKKSTIMVWCGPFNEDVFLEPFSYNKEEVRIGEQ